VPEPRSSCRSSSIRTNSDSRSFRYVWIDGASSTISSLTTSDVAIFFTGSVTSL
jgi:hypothetical protein